MKKMMKTTEAAMNESAAAASRPAQERQPDEVAEIIAWSMQPPSSTPEPAKTLLLRFRDSGLEQAYLQWDFGRSRRARIAGAAAATLLVGGLFFLDTTVAPPDISEALRIARLTCSLPVVFAVLVGALVLTRARLWIPLSAAAFAVFLLKQAVLLVYAAPYIRYLSQGLLEGILGMFLIAQLPLRVAMIVSIVCSAAFAAAAMFRHVEMLTLIDDVLVDATIIVTFCALLLYRHERASRSEFIAQAMSQHSYEKRLAIEVDRCRWLELFASFLDHELKNAMIGISSSMDLAWRTRGSMGSEKYFDRARRSLETMRRLLAQVANATTLESALRQQQVALLDFSALVASRIDDFRTDHPDRGFALNGPAEVRVVGHADALAQMLDKLLTNAIEHGHTTEPIQVELTQRDGSCELAVVNFGDALPSDLDGIFQAFVTGKKAPSASGNLGLGLFVARTIAVHHGGTLRVEALGPPDIGARFIVSLPSAQRDGPLPAQR